MSYRPERVSRSQFFPNSPVWSDALDREARLAAIAREVVHQLSARLEPSAHAMRFFHRCPGCRVGRLKSEWQRLVRRNRAEEHPDIVKPMCSKAFDAWFLTSSSTRTCSIVVRS